MDAVRARFAIDARASVFCRAKPRGAAPWTLGALQRWPPPQLRGEFPALVGALAKLAEDRSWPEALTTLLAAEPLSRRSLAQTLDDLRRISAAIAMLVHLVPEQRDQGGLALHNARRRRTAYGSYPTPPEIGAAIARHVARHLDRSAVSSTIFDPTIEGGAILLECAHVLRRRRDVQIVGIDRIPAAVVASRLMFDRGFARGAVGGGVELLVGDSLEVMRHMAPIGALVNNPPWGERQRNGAANFPTIADPYSHFVERGLDLLRPGGPFGLVLPGQAIAAPASLKLRARLAETCQVDLVAVLPKHCFPRATVRAVLVLGRKRVNRTENSRVTLVSYAPGRLGRASELPTIHVAARSEACPPGGGAWSSCRGEPSGTGLSPRTERLDRLGAITSGVVPYRLGKGRPPQSTEVLASRPFTFGHPIAGSTPVLRGRDIRRFTCLPPREFILFGPHLANVGKHAEALQLARVFVRELCGRSGALVAAPAPPGAAPRYGVFSIRLDPDVSALALCAVLNSQAAARHVQASCDGVFKESFNRIRIGDLRRFPIPMKLRSDATWVEEIELLCRDLLAAPTETARARASAELDQMVEAAYGGEEMNRCPVPAS